MSTSTPFLVVSALIGIVATIYLTEWSRKLAEGFVGAVAGVGGGSRSGLLTLGKKPTLWFVVDDYGFNSRRWVDFGARLSGDLNVGFLNLTRGRCHVTQGGDFEVVELLGRDAVAAAIRGAGGVVPVDHLKVYPYLWRAWARAALMNYLGGLYLDGLSLCLGPSFMTVVRNVDDATFGFEHDERVVDPVGSVAATPSPFAGWASGSGHIGWRGLCHALSDFIDAGAQSWTSAQSRNQVPAWNRKYLESVMKPIRTAEWSRRPDGRPIEIEDLLGRSAGFASGSAWEPPAAAIYLPIDKEALDRSVTYKWFLNMSTEQILDPDSLFLWAAAAKRGGAQT